MPALVAPYIHESLGSSTLPLGAFLGAGSGDSCLRPARERAETVLFLMVGTLAMLGLYVL
jgi:hypothetical protein